MDKLNVLALGVALYCLGTSQVFAQAAVNLSGKITVGTCSANTLTVDMPEMSASEFTAEGRLDASEALASLQLTGCAGITGVTVTYGDTADADATNAAVFRNKAATDAAPNTGIVFRRAGFVGGPVPGQVVNRPITGGAYTEDYEFYYFRLAGGPVTQGAISTTFTIGLDYY